MRQLTLGEFSTRCGGQLIGADPNIVISSYALDSREVQPGSLFLAVVGAKVDGHDFADAAVSQGAIAVVAERNIRGPQVRVGNLVEALAKLGSSFRSEFQGKVIGITGSAGKTSTKEFLASALSPLGKIGKTAGNRNTELTVPLAWAEMDGDESAMIVEMSMRGPGQIAHLANFSKPEIGIITNIGQNHVEKVGSLEGVFRAKAELFASLPASGKALYFHEDQFKRELQSAAPCPSFTFGWSDGCDAQILDYQADSWTSSSFKIRMGAAISEAKLACVGRHMAQNAAAAVLCATQLGVSLQDACNGLIHAELPPMRMEPRELNGATFVLDNYNAAPGSFITAIETLSSIPCNGRRILVAGEMKELGEKSESGHREVGAALAKTQIDQVIFYGDAMNWASSEAIRMGFPGSKLIAASSIQEIADLLTEVGASDTVLIKGSRALELEKILEFIPIKGAAHS